MTGGTDVSDETENDPAGYGPVETAYRAWIEGLGRLSPRQTAVAEQVYAVAANLDTARMNGTPAAAVASLSRALSRAADTLPSDRGDGAQVPPPAPVAGVDEVANRRRERRAASGGAAS